MKTNIRNAIVVLVLAVLFSGCKLSDVADWVQLPWGDNVSSNTPVVPPPVVVEPPPVVEPTPTPTNPPPAVETPLPPLPSLTFKETNGVVSMEAENCTSQSGYGRYARADASGKSVMRADGKTGSRLNFTFTVKQGQTWYVWIRANATTHLNNGLQLVLDGKPLSAPANHPLAGASDIYLPKTGWTWQPQWLKGESHSGPVTMQLTAGTHVLSIVKRKVENPLIDKIMLTKSSTPPSGLGI